MGTLSDGLPKVLHRKRRGFRFTQSDLGQRIGVSGSYISALENGKQSPRISELEDLAACFRTTAMALIQEAGRAEERYVVAEQPAERQAARPVPAADGAGLDTIAADLSPVGRSMAREFLLFLRERERVDAD